MQDIREKSWAGIRDDDDIKFFFHPSRLAYLPYVVPGILLAFLGFPLALNGSYLAGTAVLIIGLISITMVHIYRIQQYYIVSEYEVLEKHGFITESDPQPIVYTRMTDTDPVKPSIFHRIFGIGNIELKTAGTAEVEQNWKHVPNLDEVENYIRKRNKETGHNPATRT